MNEHITEKEYVDTIEKFLNKKGFKTFREVIPEECKEWESPFRVDLILFKEEYGYIGVEFKVMNSWKQGTVFSKAVSQIEKYRNKSFFDEKIKIKRWCIGIKEKGKQVGWTDPIRVFVETFLKHKHNIDIFDFIHYPSNEQWTRVVIGLNQQNNIRIGNQRTQLYEYI